MGHGEDEGIIPRFSDELFQKIESLKENSDDVVRVVLFSKKFQISISKNLPGLLMFTMISEFSC